MSEATNQLPPHMVKGSRGPFVNAVLFTLMAWWSRAHFLDDDPSGIELDGEFGEVGIRALNKFQEAHGGKATGDFDVDTRTDFEEELGITLDNLALIGEGTTVFVQPDGSKIMWSSTIGLMASA